MISAQRFSPQLRVKYGVLNYTEKLRDIGLWGILGNDQQKICFRPPQRSCFTSICRCSRVHMYEEASKIPSLGLTNLRTLCGNLIVYFRKLPFSMLEFHPIVQMLVASVWRSAAIAWEMALKLYEGSAEKFYYASSYSPSTIPNFKVKFKVK